MAKNPVLECLLQMIDQAFDKKSWHGTNLRGSIRGLTAAQAAWRPRPDRHSIADIVLHTAYWKYAVSRRYTGEKRGSFTVEGSNWFTIPDPLSEATWKSYIRLLEAEHRRFRAEVAKLSDRDLDIKPAKSKITHRQIIQGMAFHDVYHAGQIQVLKRMQLGG